MDVVASALEALRAHQRLAFLDFCREICSGWQPHDFDRLRGR